MVLLLSYVVVGLVDAVGGHGYKNQLGGNGAHTHSETFGSICDACRGMTLAEEEVVDVTALAHGRGDLRQS